MFTSVIILLGEFSKRKTRPNLDTKVQYASFYMIRLVLGRIFMSRAPLLS
ncbi:hypothetical protein SP70585_1394 [Streptococcus pneumoniae 70585]|uniref:Uncharacterized protein n=1 Tax=Streptococcus pneumoniae (strain 70585) TaxID=488221 RepID=C1C7V6_STRP7|nr:hypothetical protein SP70585_1394 [Streptococcus pneumoniae 70585]